MWFTVFTIHCTCKCINAIMCFQLIHLGSIHVIFSLVGNVILMCWECHSYEVFIMYIYSKVSPSMLHAINVCIPTYTSNLYYQWINTSLLYYRKLHYLCNLSHTIEYAGKQCMMMTLLNIQTLFKWRWYLCQHRYHGAKVCSGDRGGLDMLLCIMIVEALQ